MSKTCSNQSSVLMSLNTLGGRNMDKQKSVGANKGWRRDDGIVQVTCGSDTHSAGTVYSRQDALDALQLCEDLKSKNGALFLLCDIKKLKKTDSEARYIAPPTGTARLALLVESPVSRMLGNAYMGFRPPACPTRIFTEESPAVRWLISGMPSE